MRVPVRARWVYSPQKLGRDQTYLFTGAVNSIQQKGPSTSLGVERWTKTNVVFRRGTNQRGVDETRQHVQSCCQNCRVCSNAQRAFNGALLLFCLVIQPFGNKILREKTHASVRLAQVKKKGEMAQRHVNEAVLRSAHMLKPPYSSTGRNAATTSCISPDSHLLQALSQVILFYRSSSILCSINIIRRLSQNLIALF